MYTHNVHIFGATRLCSHGKRSKGTRKKLEFSSQRFDKVSMKWLVFGTWNTRFSSARRGIKMLRYSFLLFIPLREREREKDVGKCRLLNFNSFTNSSTLLWRDNSWNRVFLSAEISYNFLQKNGHLNISSSPLAILYA